MTQPPPGAQPYGWAPPPWPAPAQPPVPQYGQLPAGWGAPPPLPPQRPRNRTTVWVLAGIGAVLVLALVAVVLVAVLRADDGTDGPASSTVSTGDLLDSLPADLPDCSTADPAGDGDIAAAWCDASRTQPGPREADFFLYPDPDTLDDVFLSDVGTPVGDGGVFRGTLEPFPGEVDCATGTGWGEWSGDGAGGMIACGLSDQGDVAIVWTDSDFATEGIVYAPGTTQADVAALFDWWDRFGFFEE